MRRTVIFAEPCSKQLDTTLLPGDRLLEVNGRNVQDTSREDIIDIIRQSGPTVTLKVRFPLVHLAPMLFALKTSRWRLGSLLLLLLLCACRSSLELEATNLFSLMTRSDNKRAKKNT